jgi:hypothetical protein
LTVVNRLGAKARTKKHVVQPALANNSGDTSASAIRRSGKSAENRETGTAAATMNFFVAVAKLNRNS